MGNNKRIKFEKFLGEKLNNDRILTIILCALIIILFIVSGFFNKKFLDYKDANKKVSFYINTLNI